MSVALRCIHRVCLCTGTVGFANHSRRFNVAVSRAVCLLVVVGHPVAMAEDPYWAVRRTCVFIVLCCCSFLFAVYLSPRYVC